MLRLATIVVALSACTSAFADPVQIRLAGIAPDGASWTRELKSFSRDVESKTEGRVKVKWYWGGIAGDELAVLDRIRRNQLDGQAGAEYCDRLAPSLRVLRVLGLFQSRDETSFVLRKLVGRLEQEFRDSGFYGMVATMGQDMLFTREPIRSLAQLKATKIWVWDLDEIVLSQLRRIGFSPVALPLDKAAAAYDSHRIDGFLAIPTAALAFQWSAQSKYFSELRVAYLPGCLVIANRVFDALSNHDQGSIREAVAKLRVRFEDLGRTQDAELLDGLFAKQGTQPANPSATLRTEFLELARDGRQAIPPSLLSPDLLRDVQSWLADYRAEHAER